MKYRNLTGSEITTLESRGCSCSDWSRIEVAEPFNPARYRNVCFIGDNRLGAAEAVKTYIAGIPRETGIYDATLSNCTVGRDVYIHDVTGGLVNVEIEDDVRIESVFRICCEGESTFGNNVKVSVLSETGGREVAINTSLSAPVAYMEALYRHNALLSKKLQDMSDAYAESLRSSRCRVGAGSDIANCGCIINVDILGKSTIHNTPRLENGTVRNATIGADVVANDFIVLDGATVGSSALLNHAFVGQGSTLASLFSAHDSLFFCNCHLENGEAAATFAGPFTNSMHKSTLLIGGLFSFFNAGSGTNQSNHMYKLGPMHQGITTRGVKTASDCYILWPAAIGTFTMVMGRHYSHPDTRKLPFGYLIADEHNRSILLPGAAIASIGTARDVDKWPARDKRDALGLEKIDPVNYHWLSPYTLQTVLEAIDLLNKIQLEKTLGDHEEYIYNGVVLNGKGIRRGLMLYRLLTELFVGTMVRGKIMRTVSTRPEITPEELCKAIQADPGSEGEGLWIDMAGMQAPRGEIQKIIDRLIAREDATFDWLNGELNALNDRYLSLAWSWLWHNMEKFTGIKGADLTAGDIAGILQRGATSAEEFEHHLRKDANKEFNPEVASIGFGIDAPDDFAEIRDDFERVRGTLASQRFLSKLHQQLLTYIHSLQSLLPLFES